MPSNRALLKDIHTTDAGEKVGEGTVIRFIGFLIKGAFSNWARARARASTANSRTPRKRHPSGDRGDKPPANPTAAQLVTLECNAVVAEISPHFRPEAWEIMGTLAKTQASSAAKKIAAQELIGQCGSPGRHFSTRRTGRARTVSPGVVKAPVVVGDSSRVCDGGLQEHDEDELPGQQRFGLGAVAQVA